jgi:hypothetical protein
MRSWNALLVLVVAVAVPPASAQRAGDPTRIAPGQTCTPITQANADASAGTVNIHHDGTPLVGTPAPDISRGFSGIPRWALPRLTASLQRILECTHRLAEANRRHSLHAVRAVDLRPAEASTPRGRSARPEHHATATDPVRRHHGLRRAIRIHRPCTDGIQPVKLVGQPDRNAGPHRGRAARR